MIPPLHFSGASTREEFWSDSSIPYVTGLDVRGESSVTEFGYEGLRHIATKVQLTQENARSLFQPYPEITDVKSNFDGTTMHTISSRVGFLTRVENPWVAITGLGQFRPRAEPVDRAVELYASGKISLGQAAQEAGMKYDEMIDELLRRKVSLAFGPETAEEADEEEQALREWLSSHKSET